MAHGDRSLLTGVSEAAQSIAVGAWLVAAVSIPAALLLHSYGTALLIVILVVVWQFMAVLLVAVSETRPTSAGTRYRHKLTGWGAVYCLAAGVFCLVAVHWGINLLYLTAAFLTAGAVCALVFPSAMLARTSTEWDLPQHVFAAEPFLVEVGLRNDKRLLGLYGVFVGVADGDGEAADERDGYRLLGSLPPGTTERLLLRQFMPERGLQRLHPVELRTSFPFGILETVLESRLEQDVLVLPRLGHIRQDQLHRHKGGEARWLEDLRRKDQHGEFRGLREYAPGDDPRFIHWSTSARLRKLHVREFERREMHSVLILLDTSLPPMGEAEAYAWRERFEWAVSFVATLASVLTERNVYYAFASFCPELVSLPYDQGRGHFIGLMEVLAMAEPTPEKSLHGLVQALSFHDVSTGGVCLVTAGPLADSGGTAALGPLSQCSVAIDASSAEFHEIFSH